MRLLRAYTKPGRDSPMCEADHVRLVAGLGIEGDVNAAQNSPRQVLIASAPVYARLGLEPCALRENFLVDGEIERLASGQVLRIGKSTLVRLTIPCEPCAKLNRVRAGLARDVAGHRGFLARVLTDGEVRVGDECAATERALPPIPLRPRERVYDLVSRIPFGRVLGFKALVKTLGLTRTYVRVIPRFLVSAPGGLPVHRVVTTDGALIPQHVHGQAGLLREEGVHLTHGGRVGAGFLWDSTEYFGAEALAIG